MMTLFVSRLPIETLFDYQSCKYREHLHMVSVYYMYIGFLTDDSGTGYTRHYIVYS